MHFSKASSLLALCFATYGEAAAAVTSTKTITKTTTKLKTEVNTKTRVVTSTSTKIIPKTSTSTKLKTVTSTRKVYSTECVKTISSPSPSPSPSAPTNVGTPNCADYYRDYYFYDYDPHPYSDCASLPFPTPLPDRSCIPKDSAKCFTLQGSTGGQLDGYNVTDSDYSGRLTQDQASPFYTDANTGITYMANHPDTAMVAEWRSPSWMYFESSDRWFSENGLYQPVMCTRVGGTQVNCTNLEPPVPPRGNEVQLPGLCVYPTIGDQRYNLINTYCDSNDNRVVPLTLNAVDIDCPSANVCE